MIKNLLKQQVFWPVWFTVALLVIRMIFTGQLVYIFLASNLFLAILPFMISRYLRVKTGLKQWKIFILVLAWLLLLPNAPYIITDFFHLKERSPVPYWYDIILLFSAALNGLILFMLSIKHMDDYLTSKYGKKIAYRMLILFFFLCGFGIYLGRYERWYSWDVIMNGDELLVDIMHRVIFPWEHLRTWSITVLFGLFLSISYFSLKGNKITDN